MVLRENIPELRFPGFEGDWLNTSLDKHFFNRRESGNENLPIYSVTIDSGMVPRESLERIIGNDAASEDNLLVKANDLAYNMMRLWQGAIGLAQQNCMISPAYVVLGPYDNVCSSFFIHLFARSRSLYLFTSTSYGITGDRLRLYYKDFSSIKFPVPKYPEQQKIASFLTSVDQKLTQLKKKKALLEQYKAGVMQQIFSQQIRFKDDEGREFPEWEEKCLSQIGECYIGLTYSPNDVVDNGGTLVLRSSNIQNGTLAFEDNVYVNAVIPEKNFVKENDILICARNGSRSLIGKCALIKKQHEGYAFGAFMSVFRSENNPFLYQIFQTDYFHRQINEHLGATINQVTTKSLNSFKFLFPCLNEQQKISSFLNGIDKKIDHCGLLVKRMEQWKKGLLQRMFC